jgi:hypothetical protein
MCIHTAAPPSSRSFWAELPSKLGIGDGVGTSKRSTPQADSGQRDEHTGFGEEESIGSTYKVVGSGQGGWDEAASLVGDHSKYSGSPRRGACVRGAISEGSDSPMRRRSSAAGPSPGRPRFQDRSRDSLDLL